jgi:hypothetical protein
MHSTVALIDSGVYGGGMKGILKAVAYVAVMLFIVAGFHIIYISAWWGWWVGLGMVAVGFTVLAPLVARWDVS